MNELKKVHFSLYDSVHNSSIVFIYKNLKMVSLINFFTLNLYK